MQVTILHNITSDGYGRNAGTFGYRPGHALVPVFHYDVSLSDFDSACEVAFRLFNVGDDPEFGVPDERALEYRAAKNRSLSVGDVVRLTAGKGEWWFACASSGWTKIERPDFLVWASCHGSTPLDANQYPIEGVYPPMTLD